MHNEFHQDFKRVNRIQGGEIDGVQQDTKATRLAGKNQEIFGKIYLTKL